MRHLIILGIFVASSASIPILYQSNPDVFQGLPSLAASQTAGETGPAVGARVEASVGAISSTNASGRKVRLAVDERGHFTGEFRLNGRRMEAIVDTGASVVAINQTTARRIGLMLRSTDFSLSVDTANGSTKAAMARIAELQIGRIVVKNVDAVVLEDDALRHTLIGMSFLNRLGSFQVKDGVLLLTQ